MTNSFSALENYDLLIVGAGPVGCTVAAQAAEHGWRCLLIDRRSHLAGNCHDYVDSNGLLLHRYGPHYFRTDRLDVLNFLSRYTDWIPGNYIVKSAVDDVLYPFPINLTTLEMFFKRSFTARSAEEFMSRQRIPISKPLNSEEWVLSRVGWSLYKAFYLNYTRKQWGRSPKQLDASVCGRVPVRFNRDNRYINQRYQVMPARGYTALFSSMVRHPKIDHRLHVDFASLKKKGRPKIATVYTGPLDAYFDFKLGRLPWRSLRFEKKTYDVPYRQPCVQINYPNEHAYTRSVEIKHVTGQQHAKTVVVREYPMDKGEPYYPIPSESAQSLFQRYWALAQEETREKQVYFAGRLAEYRYLNTDQAVMTGFDVWKRIKSERGKL